MRLEETYGADNSITAGEFRDYKYDLRYSQNSAMMEIVNGILAIDAGDDAELRKAQELLHDWDRRTDVASCRAVLAVLTAEPVSGAGIRRMSVTTVSYTHL